MREIIQRYKCIALHASCLEWSLRIIPISKAADNIKGYYILLHCENWPNSYDFIIRDWDAILQEYGLHIVKQHTFMKWVSLLEIQLIWVRYQIPSKSYPLHSEREQQRPELEQLQELVEQEAPA